MNIAKALFVAYAKFHQDQSIGIRISGKFFQVIFMKKKNRIRVKQTPTLESGVLIFSCSTWRVTPRTFIILAISQIKP